ncbi:unnamed protein product [Prorocentrum cordatum]|uniref:S1 motif domain-containing protein n=1 Tax=Prorocentrum cordatum TaxID=2364126 RepID=A0ABN9WZ05_9DINO|nr:unnamed protein product [Polarella glacialis]
MAAAPSRELPLHGDSWADLGHCDSDDGGFWDVSPGFGAAPNVGSCLEGIVAYTDERGAYVEVGLAAAALLPWSAGAAGLRAGDEVDGLRMSGLDADTGRLLLGLREDDPEPEGVIAAPWRASAGAAAELEELPRKGLVPLPPLPRARSGAAALGNGVERERLQQLERWRRPSAGTAHAERPPPRPVPEELRRTVQSLLERVRPDSLEAVCKQLASLLSEPAEFRFLASALVRVAIAPGGCSDRVGTLAALGRSLHQRLSAAAGGGCQGGSPERAGLDELLAEACSLELWLPAVHAATPDAASEGVTSAAQWAAARRGRTDSVMRLIAGLISEGLAPAGVAGVVAAELLLARDGVCLTGTLPGEEDVRAACALLRAAGGLLQREPSGPGALRRLCERLVQLLRAKRTNGDAVNPTVLVYAEGARQEMLHSLRLHDEGWPLVATGGGDLAAAAGSSFWWGDGEPSPPLAPVPEGPSGSALEGRRLALDAEATGFIGPAAEEAAADECDDVLASIGSAPPARQLATASRPRPRAATAASAQTPAAGVTSRASRPPPPLGGSTPPWASLLQKMQRGQACRGHSAQPPQQAATTANAPPTADALAAAPAAAPISSDRPSAQDAAAQGDGASRGVPSEAAGLLAVPPEPAVGRGRPRDEAERREPSGAAGPRAEATADGAREGPPGGAALEAPALALPEPAGARPAGAVEAAAPAGRWTRRHKARPGAAAAGGRGALEEDWEAICASVRAELAEDRGHELAEVRSALARAGAARRAGQPPEPAGFGTCARCGHEPAQCGCR